MAYKKKSQELNEVVDSNGKSSRAKKLTPAEEKSKREAQLEALEKFKQDNFDTIRVPKRNNKLDAEGLLRLGFTEHDDKSGLNKVYRIKPSMYYYPMIQMQIRPDLPRTNANCGILSIYHPAVNDEMITDEGMKPISFPESVTPIAWYVDTYERMRSIINSLTHSNQHLMSTVSLMPLRKKFTVKKDTNLKVTSSLSTASNLKEAGILLKRGELDEIIFLEEGVLLRVDGFGGDLSDDPTVKLSVFPTAGRMGQIYVNLEDLDGLVWDTYQEAPKKEKPLAKKIEVFINYPSESDHVYVYHSALGGRFDRSNSDWVLLNPLALSAEELEKKMFTADKRYSAGQAVYKYGSKVHTYNLQWVYSYFFKTRVGSNGLLEGKMEWMAVELQIVERNASSNWEVVVRETRQSDEIYEDMVKIFIKNKHADNELV